MKRLEELLPIGPKEAEELRLAGVRTLQDLANPKSAEELSTHTSIPADDIRQLQAQAHQRLKATHYWRRVAIGVGIASLGLILWYSRKAAQTASAAPTPETLGEQYYDKAQYSDAVAEFDKAIQADPKNRFAYANKGGALRRLGKTQDAVAALNKALEFDPNDIWALDERATALEDLGQYQAALNDAQRVVQLDPKHAYAYGNQAFALRRLGRYQEALAAINKDAELNPKDAWIFNERAIIYHDNLHQYELAYEDDKKAAELAPTDLNYQENLAEAALTTGHFQEAYELASKLLAAGTPYGKPLDVSSQMSMRFIVISALLLQQRTAEGSAKLKEFVDYYKSVPPNYERHWDYSGDREFIKGRAMDNTSKEIIVELTELLDPNSHSSIEKSEKLIGALQVNSSASPK